MAEDRAKTFPFNVTMKQYDDHFDTSTLNDAAKSNNLPMLQHLLNEFGGVFYHSSVARFALKAGNFDFWKMFVLGSCRTNILTFHSHHILDFRFYMQPFHDLFYIDIPDNMRLDAMRILCEQYLPALPDEQDLNDQSDLISLPRHRKYTIWSLPDFRTFPDDIPGRYNVVTYCVQRGDDQLLRYILEEVGAHTRLSDLQFIAMRFRPDLYDLVFQHLRPDIDRDQIPISCLYREPQNDADFIVQFSHDFVHDDRWLPLIIKFIEMNSHMNFDKKLYAAKRFFEEFLANAAKFRTAYPWLKACFNGTLLIKSAITTCQMAANYFGVQDKSEIVLDLHSLPLKFRIYHREGPREEHEKRISDEYPSDQEIAVECNRFCYDCAGQDYGLHDPECSSSDSDHEDDGYSGDNRDAQDNNRSE